MAIDPALYPILPVLLAEANQLVEQCTKDILALERGESAAALRAQYVQLARALHTLKGTCGTTGMDDVSELMHQLETLLARPLAANVRLPADYVDVLLKGTDEAMRRVRAYAAAPERELEQPEALLHRITELREGGGTFQPLPSAQDVAPSSASTPTPSQARPEELEGSWRVSAHDIDALTRQVERLREIVLRLEVRAEELDRISRTLPAGMDPSGSVRFAMQSLGRTLSTDQEETADLIAALEDDLKTVCTLPVRTILQPLERTVRDLCRQLGKRARLSVVGGELSLDRRLLEALRGPLVHLVRNAMDHGVEAPEVREAHGKHGEAILVIRAEQQGNLVLLEVSDDGGGIEPQRIRAEARRRELVSDEELDQMDDAATIQLIFRPGFSTAPTVTEISGRGVGLDVVQSQVSELRGRLEVHSKKGQGTRFLLMVPSQLGSSPTLTTRVGDLELGLPLMDIQGAIPVRTAALSFAGDRTFMHHGDALLELRDLGALLGLRDPLPALEGKPLLILRGAKHSIGLMVDDILGDREVVIRPLPFDLLHLPAYQGTGTTPRGESILVLRTAWLLGTAAGHSRRSARRALVVEDSLTARALHRVILEAAGYAVQCVASAGEALQVTERTDFDVMVSDIQLGGMDGLALTSRLRQTPRTARLPVVLVSAGDGEALRSAALGAGADAFLTKADCAAGRLLTDVAAAIELRGLP